MHPFLAAKMQPASERPPLGRYDETRGLTVDEAGRPLAARWLDAETLTEARTDPGDPALGWALETMTKVAQEPADDAGMWAETLTRVLPESPDPAEAAIVLLPADDSVTGFVGF